MDFDCKRKVECMKKFCGYCCTYKRDLLRNNNFEKSIEIVPRVIVCPKLEKCGTYHQSLTVKNTGTLTRRMKFITEPNTDVSFKVNGNTELTSGLAVSVDVYVEPTKKGSTIDNRYFYVWTEHPDIVWEIPIIVTVFPPTIYVPQIVCLHKVPANTTSYYQFILYNPLENGVSASLDSKSNDITIEPSNATIAAKDVCKILLSAKVPDQPMTQFLEVYLSNEKRMRIIAVRMEPSQQLIHLSTSVITFEDTFMGFSTQKNIHICNKSMDNVSFQWSAGELIGDTKPNDKEDGELTVSEFIKIRNKRGCINPMSSVLSIVTFSPSLEFEYNEEEEPPFKISTAIYLFCPLLGPHSYQLLMNASILGPNIEILPKDVNLGSIYMGEMQYLSFNVVNHGPIPGRVSFKEHTDVREIRCSINPLLVVLKPHNSRAVKVHFYRRDIGKFLTKITFKIKCGNSLPVLLRGNSLAVKVKVWPEHFDLGDIPVCIPQKRFALITNPLPVPVVVEPKVIDDGHEDPLILCVDYSKLPLHTRPATFYSMKEEKLSMCVSDFRLEDKMSMSSVNSSEISSLFEDKVLDDIPALASELLQNVKISGPQYQPEPGTKIIDAALDCILDNTDYFENLKEKQHYLQINWECLPNDAKEIAIEEEHFYLNPNESRSFPVILIPNNTGPNTKDIEFKACPIASERYDLKTAVRSKYMVESLRLRYKCTAPKVVFDDFIKLSDPVYVDMEYKVKIKIANIDTVPGFVIFNWIPKTNLGAMKVDPSQRKFFLAPDNEVIVICSVTFRSIGTIQLHGMFKLIGKLIDYPFTITANVLPPAIQIEQEKLMIKQDVLKLTRTRIFFENICPTVAKFSLSLKNERYQFLEPLGGSLAPKQKICISIWSRYLDPGTYKNVITVHLMHAKKLTIPLTFTIDGIPIKFNPNIKEGFNLGGVFVKKEVQVHPIKITNYGERSYRLLFKKKLSKKGSIVPPQIFDIQSNEIRIDPSAQMILSVTVDISKEICANEEYSVDGMGEDNNRFKFFTFNAKCTVVISKLVWSKNQVCLEAGNAEESQNKLSDTVVLINTSPLGVNVNLNMTGCFCLCDQTTGLTDNLFNFTLEGKASRQFVLSLNLEEIDSLDICESFEGSVKCKANNKPQRILQMYGKILNPGLKICTPDVTFFTENTESYAHVLIENSGSLQAAFTWKPKTLNLTKTVCMDHYELLASKTISEKILSLSKYIVPEIPNQIEWELSEDCESDEETSDGDESKTSISKKSASNLSCKKSLTTTDTKNIEEKSQNTIKEIKSASSLEIPSFNINEILDSLGLAPSTNCQTTKCSGFQLNNIEETNCVVFQQPSSTVLPRSIVKAYMYLPPIAQGYTISTKFDLNVKGGHTEVLDITVTSLKGRVQINQTDFDLGTAIWHTIITTQIKITNLCPYAVKVRLIGNTDEDMESKVINGFVGVAAMNMFIMMPDASACIDCRVLLGLRYNFSDDIGIEINNNTTPIPIHFHGTGLMPMITPVNLKKLYVSSHAIAESYLTIRTIFEHDEAKKNPFNPHFTENDELISASKLATTLSIDPEDEGDRSIINESNDSTKKGSIHDAKIHSDFVALNFDEAVPKGLDIERLIETWKFLDLLNTCRELRTRFHKYYCNAVCVRAMQFDEVVNLKHLICRPVPWALPAFHLDIGDIKMNEMKSFQLEFVFIGPGKMFLSARTETQIPGLMAWFEDYQNVCGPSYFTFFVQSPPETTKKKYKNMSERDNVENIDSQEAVRLAHAHSYDFDENCRHHRKRSFGEIKKIKERYTKLNQPFKEVKNPLILAEMCQITDASWDNTSFKLFIIITAAKEFYDNNQQIQDFLFIDTHFGPTLPVLLQGTVVKK